MAPPSGRNRAPVSQELFDEAYRFDFFQAVRLLERMAWEQSGKDGRGERHPVGQDHGPEEEAVRFRAVASHSFPTGSIRQIRRPTGRTPDEAGEPPPEMSVSFAGLTGPHGVLPRHYTTLMIERIRQKDYALRDFFDVFNHRTVSLFYRSWEKYRFPVAYERSELTGVEGKEDLFTQVLYCLVGLGTGRLRGRLEFDDEAFLFYAGYFAHFPRSAVVLEIMLADYFELPVEVRQFQGQWLQLSEEDRSALSCPGHPRGVNNEMGKSLLAGERVWDVASKFRVRIGPLTYRQFCSFLPSEEALKPFCQMVRAYAGPQFDFDVQLVLLAHLNGECVAGAVFLRLRPLVLAAVTISEMGLAMTLLFDGSGLDIPRTSELLGSCLHGTLWLVYLSCHIAAETLAQLTRAGAVEDG